MNEEKNEFDKADITFPLQTTQAVEVLPPDKLNHVPHDVVEHRDQLVKKYHNGVSSLSERLKLEGKDNIESLVTALIDEVIKETDNLLGNELIATQNGSLRDATIISEKRAAVLAQVIKAAQAKQLFEKEHGIDLDSPSMRIVFQYFMGKVRKTFKNLNYQDEVSDVFFRNLGASMDNWKKELREEITALSGLQK
jgi:hypothetical protein